MNLESLKALSDDALTQILAAAQEELKARAEKRKQETIAKIKELAGAVGVSVAILGQRGRPSKVKQGVNGDRKAAEAPLAERKNAARA